MGRIEEKISSLENKDRNYEREREVIRTKQFESDARLSNLISHVSDLKTKQSENDTQLSKLISHISDLKRSIEEQGKDISKLKEEIAEIKVVIEPFKNIRSLRNFLYISVVTLVVVIISSFFVSDQVIATIIGLFQALFR